MVAVRENIAEFTFFRPGARCVYLVGDFNGWRPDELPLTRCEDGCWRGMMRLPKGTFNFRYLADGQWYIDYASFGVWQGPFGPNSVVRIAG